MRTKLFTVLSLLVLASMVLAACGPQATPTAQVIEKTVVVGGTPQTVVVTATPETAAPTAPAEFKSKDPTTFVVQFFGEPETLDPALDYETAGGGVIDNVYDKLLWWDHNKKTVVPMIATEVPSVENGGISADGMTYTFKIRQGVKFHDGSDMTPSDVAFTFQRGILQGGTVSPQWLFTEPVLGSTGYNDITDQLDPDGSLGLADNREELLKVDAAKLKEACQKVKDAIVADDAAGTVTFKLAQSWGPFLVTFAGGWGAIQSQKWVGANGGWDGSCDTWQNFYAMTSDEIGKTKVGTSGMGTGPYMLDHWTPTEEIVLKANDNYWMKEPLWEGAPTGAPALKTVIIKQVDEFSTRFAAFQAGDADVIVVGSPADWPQMDTLVGEECDQDGNCTVTDPSKPFRVFKGLTPVNRTDAFLNFAMDTNGGNNFIGSGKLDGNGVPPDFFSDIHIRKAFAYCFDWDTYNKDVFQGEASQAFTVMMPGEIGADPNQAHYSYDPAKCEEEFKASTLKAADGKSLWDTGFRLTIAYNTGNTARQTISQILQQEIGALNENFIIEVTGIPWAAFLKAQRAKKLPVFVSGWQEDIPDPHNWLYPYASAGGTYSGRQSLPKELLDQFQPLITAGVHEADPAKRQTIYQQFNQLYYENVPTILLSNGFGRHYEQRWVKNYYYNPMYSEFWYYAQYAKQ